MVEVERQEMRNGEAAKEAMKHDQSDLLKLHL
jgi:hypothetical protein